MNDEIIIRFFNENLVCAKLQNLIKLKVILLNFLIILRMQSITFYYNDVESYIETSVNKKIL